MSDKLKEIFQRELDGRFRSGETDSAPCRPTTSTNRRAVTLARRAR